MKFKIQIFFYLLTITGFLLATGCQHSQKQQGQERLVIFHAGSLTVPFKKMAEEFESENPQIKVFLEAAGSRESARKISSLQKPCDIIASADYAVIEDLLIPEYADWYIYFARNELCIAYTSSSRFKDRIDSVNWIELLLNDSVFYGRSNPDTDPCGYRTVLTFKLAETYYDKPGAALRFEEKDRRFIRPKEVDLLALLESRAIDYLFIYTSVAKQHGLKYITLPDQINLKEPRYTDLYATVSMEISGKNPGEKIVQKGEPMLYAVSILKDAEHYKNAITFLEFLLSPQKGLRIMEESGQETFVGTEKKYIRLVPEQLKKYLDNEN